MVVDISEDPTYHSAPTTTVVRVLGENKIIRTRQSVGSFFPVEWLKRGLTKVDLYGISPRVHKTDIQERTMIW